MDGPDWTIRIICWDVYAKAQLGLDLWLLAVMVMVILMIIVMTYGSDLQMYDWQIDYDWRHPETSDSVC